jgi:predicted dehydrogenase
MIRIGLVDLDTSHPGAFTAILNKLEDVKVTALWDGHDVYPPGYDQQFAREHGIEHVCSSLTELVDKVDAAMIHGVDWDKHIEKAIPFLEARKPILIDKPIVGRIRDVNRILELQARYKSPIFGGSSLRFADEVEELNRMKEDFGEVYLAAASGPGDIFAYGIHTTEMAQGFLGSDVETVEFLGERKAELYKVTYENGFILLLQLLAPYHEWSFCLYTGTGLQARKIDSTKIYPPFLRQFLKVVRGERVSFSLADPLEAVKVHIAAQKSKLCRRIVRLDELLPEDGFEGAAYAVNYAAAKRK